MYAAIETGPVVFMERQLPAEEHRGQGAFNGSFDVR